MKDESTLLAARGARLGPCRYACCGRVFCRQNSTAGGETTTTTTTTTEAPYRISRQELFGILQRNSIGLGRLFRKEYNQAMEVSG